MEVKALRITRLGCLAVHLMPFDGDLYAAVERIVKDGPKDEREREAVRLANAKEMPDPKFREETT